MTRDKNLFFTLINLLNNCMAQYYNYKKRNVKLIYKTVINNKKIKTNLIKNKLYELSIKIKNNIFLISYFRVLH